MYEIKEFQAFLDQAEKLLPQPLDVSLAACQSFLDAAEEQLLPRWKEQVDLLREHDRRCFPDYQSINFMKILGVAREEQPHSCFIGWLLDPKGSHNLGNGFLKPFLQKAQEICGQEDFELDLSEVQVELERGSEQGRPDITIETPNCLCIIENKLMAPEGDRQTERYADAAEAEAPDKRRLLVFLTPGGRMPRDERFNSMSYVQVLELLDSLAQSSLRSEVRFAILQFITNIRETILGEKPLQDRLIRLLDDYESKGDVFLIRNWSRFSKTITDLERRNPNGQI